MQSSSNAPGKGFLKIPGIIMIVGGALIIVIMILAMLGKNLGFGDVVTDAFKVSGSNLWWTLIANLVLGVFMLIMGIVGVKFCDQPQKATICLVFAIIGLVFAGVTVTTSSGYQWSSGFGVVLPALFLVGAILNKYVGSPSSGAAR